MRRLARRLLCCLVLVGTAMGCLASPADAHADLVSSDPVEGQVLDDAPPAAKLVFNEPVRVAEDAVRVFDAAGAEVTTEEHTRDRELLVDLPDGLGKGSYVIYWRVTSADGHVVSGVLTFAVGAPSPVVAEQAPTGRSSPTEVAAAAGIAQGAYFLSVLGAGGIVLFLLFVSSVPCGLVDARGRLSRLAGAVASAVVVFAYVTHVLTNLSKTGDGLSRLLAFDAYGLSADRESLALALAIAGVGIAVLVPRGRQKAVDFTARIAGLVLAFSALASVGHTRAYGPGWLMVVVDLVHLSAASFWLGGLVGLLVTSQAVDGRPDLVVRLLARFSVIAAGLVVAVAITGSILALYIVGSWSSLWASAFGQLLVVKILLVGVVLGVAAFNRYRLLPEVLATKSPSFRDGAGLRVRRAIGVEACLLVVVLGVAGFLVDRSPVVAPPGNEPVSASARTFQGTSGQVEVVLTVEPLTVGTNELRLEVTSSNGDDPNLTESPVVTASAGALDLGEQVVTRLQNGSYLVTMTIPTAGTWTIRVSVRLTKFDNPVVSIAVPVPAAT